MIANNGLTPKQLRRDPAVGFLALTEFLVFLRLADNRNLADWKSVKQCLENLDRALREYLASEELDPDIAREFIVHRDRVTHTLDSWQAGSVNSVSRAIMQKQEQYWRRIQRMQRVERVEHTVEGK